MDYFKRRISASLPTYRRDVGELYLLIREALDEMEKLYLTSPHWTEPPTKEMLEQEKVYEQEMEDAQFNLERMAAEIFLALTNKRIPRSVLETLIDSYRTAPVV